MERLQKVMAEAGVASRRQCEDIILSGRVKVNGTVVRKLPVLVDAEHDVVVVDGKKLRFEHRVYFLLHKPKRVVCTNHDPQGRRRAIDLLKGIRQRVFPVGRLDTDSTGLLIMTNDGELANQLTHPRYGIVKTYQAEIAGAITPAEVSQLKKGIHLDVGLASAERVTVLRRGPRQSLIEVALREGRNRQIRRMLARLGHPIRQLTRVRIGRLTLRGLGIGNFRPLTKDEIKYLKQLVNKATAQAAANPPRKRRPQRNVAKPPPRKSAAPSQAGRNRIRTRIIHG